MTDDLEEVWGKAERKKRSKKCSNPKGFTMRQFCKNVHTRSKKGERKNEAQLELLRDLIRETIQELNIEFV